MRLKRYARVNARLNKFPRFTAPLGAVAVFLVIGVVAAAMLMAARQPSAADIATARAHLQKATAEAAAKKASASSAANASVPKPAAVTMTGCLERHDETFRLKDTAGVDAPKARSWKSGFLKKGSASIDVVDAANRLKLTAHVGQRVSVTGVLIDREMQLRSLQRVAASCS
jgi:hypothetical protein